MVLMVDMSLSMPMYSFTARAFPFGPSNPLTLNVFPMRLAGFEPGGQISLLQCIGQRALRSVRDRASCPTSMALLNCPAFACGPQAGSRMTGLLRPENSLLPGHSTPLRHLQMPDPIGCEYPGQVIQSGNRSRRYLHVFSNCLITIAISPLPTSNSRFVCTDSNISVSSGRPDHADCIVDFAFCKRTG